MQNIINGIFKITPLPKFSLGMFSIPVSHDLN